MRRLRSSAVELTLDSAGRLALGKLDAVDESLRPGQPTRRVRLGIVDDIMIIGNGDRFEIWDANKWLAEQDDGQDPFDFFDVD
jgi:MraZ protein